MGFGSVDDSEGGLPLGPRPVGLGQEVEEARLDVREEDSSRSVENSETLELVGDVLPGIVDRQLVAEEHGLDSLLSHQVAWFPVGGNLVRTRMRGCRC
jgi:hypothetical protein